MKEIAAVTYNIPLFQDSTSLYFFQYSSHRNLKSPHSRQCTWKYIAHEIHIYLYLANFNSLINETYVKLLDLMTFYFDAAPLSPFYLFTITG